LAYLLNGWVGVQHAEMVLAYRGNRNHSPILIEPELFNQNYLQMAWEYPQFALRGKRFQINWIHLPLNANAPYWGRHFWLAEREGFSQRDARGRTPGCVTLYGLSQDDPLGIRPPQLRLFYQIIPASFKYL
jgi:hypothetical protein